MLWQELIAAGSDPHAGVWDPACGMGSLLIPALRAAAARSGPLGLSDLEQRFGGVDLDPVAVELGNVVLAAELLPAWAALPPRRRGPLPELLSVADGLDHRALRPKTIVLNPPYGRVRLSHQDRVRWSDALFGHANRYALFVRWAIEHVADGGLVGAVLPTSFLGGSYFQRLRELIGREAPLRRVAFVEDRSGVFVGVLQETCLAIFEKGGTASTVACARVTVNQTTERVEIGSVALRQEAAPWPLPRHRDQCQLVGHSARLPHRLSDYGWHASTGPLVWNRHKSQIHERNGLSLVPIVWAADIGDLGVHGNPTRDHRRYVALRERDSFMRLAEPAVLVQRTTAPEQSRRLVAAELDAEALARWGGVVVVENHVNVLRRESGRPAMSAMLLTRLLRTETLDRLYRCLTGSVAVSSYELAALPLPPPEIVAAWEKLDSARLGAAVAAYYGEHGASE